MLDFIMKKMGYEKLENIKIQKDFSIPKQEKIEDKIHFYLMTGEFQEKIVINENNELLDGYTTYLLNKWSEIKYVKVLRIDCSTEVYKLSCKRSERKIQKRGKSYERNTSFKCKNTI